MYQSLEVEARSDNAHTAVPGSGESSAFETTIGPRRLGDPPVAAVISRLRGVAASRALFFTLAVRRRYLFEDVLQPLECA